MKTRFLLLIYLLLTSPILFAQWNTLNSPPGGDIRDIERISTGTLYAVVSGELYQSTNNASSWSKVSIVTPVSGIHFEDIMIGTSNKLYGLTYSELYTSVDGGLNWTKVSTTNFYGVYRIMKYGPDGFLALSGWNGIWVSKDDGATFTQVLTDGSWDNNRITSNAAGDLFIGTSTGVKRHLYPGASGSYTPAGWTTILPMNGSVNNINLGVDALNNLYLSASYYDNANSKYVYFFHRSTAASNGDVWSALPRTGWYANDSNLYGFWALQGTTLYYFNNGAGDQIASIANPTPTNATLASVSTTNGSGTLTVANASSVKIGDVVSGTGIPANTYVTSIDTTPTPDNIFISNNATATGTITLNISTMTTPWVSVASPVRDFGGSSRTVAFASTANYFVGGDNSGIFATTNSGTTFSFSSNGIFSGYGNDIAVANGTGSRIFLINGTASKGYWVSADNGSTWTFTSTPDYYRNILELSGGTILIYGDKILRSTDNTGATFNLAGGTNTYVSAITQDPNTGDVYYSDGGTNVYRSIDQGATFNSFAMPATLPTGGIVRIAFGAPGVMYVLRYEYTDYKYRAYKVSGGTATLLPNAPWLSAQYFYPSNMFVFNSKLFVASSDAIYVTSDEGATWNTNGFSGNYVFPVSQGSFSGIAVSRYGTLYITQNEGQTFNSTQIPNSNSIISELAIDNSGKFLASAINSPVLKYTGSLVVDPATLPPVINFTWQPTAGPYGGFSENLIKDNSNKIYTFSWRGYYKADLAVTNWSQLSFPSGYNYFYGLGVNKSTGTLYGQVYNQLFSSTNSGSTWTLVNSENIQNRYRLMVCPNGNIVSVSSYKQIYISTNGGTTFGAAKLNLGTNSMYDDDVLVSTSSNVIIIGYYDQSAGVKKLKKTADAGTTWTDIILPATETDFNRLTVDNSGNIYLITWNNIYKSTDVGVTWSSIKGDLTGSWNYQSRVFVAPSGDLLLTGVGNRTIFKSANGGTNWTSLASVKIDIYNMEWVGSKIVASGTGVITSTDSGSTFSDTNTGIANGVNGRLMIGSASRILYGSSDFSAITQNSGTAWASTPQLSLQNFFTLPDGSTVAMEGYGNRVVRSTDGGQTWGTYFVKPPTVGALTKYFTADGNTHYFITYNELWYSTNLTTWTKLNVAGFPPSLNMQDLSVDANGIVYVIFYNYTTSKTEAYQVLFGSGIQLNQVNNPQSLVYKNNKTYLFGAEGIIASTTDGSTWTKKSAPSGSRFSITAKDYFFVYQYGGILWLSRDQGQSWQNVGLTNWGGNGFTDVQLNELDGYAYAAIDGSVVRKSDKIILADDATPPVLVSFSPVNNATGISIKPQLTITFDEGVIPQAVKTIRILDVNNQVTPVETILVTDGIQNGKSFTFTLTNFLSYNKQYFVVIDAGAYKDIFGNAYAGLINNTTWRFTTKAAPTVISTSPAVAATGVAINTSFSVTFSESITGAVSKNAYLYESAAPANIVTTFPVTTPAPQFATVLPSGAAASQSVTLIFDATQGGKELLGATKVYAHAGVVTSSASGTDWNYVKGIWGLDNGVGEMTQVVGDPNLWQITFGATLRQYFGVPDATSIYRIAVIFRSADGSIKATLPASLPTGQLNSNGDLLIDLAQTAPACSPYVTKAGNTLTLTGCNLLKNSTQYFIKFDPLALLSSEGSPISLITNNTDWTFTTVAPPDTQGPTFSYTPDNINAGAGNKTFSVTITDNVGVTGAQIFYRPITTNASVTNANLTLNNGKWEISVPETTFGKLGLEYYFTATDAAGNSTRNPITGNHNSYINIPTSNSLSLPSDLIGSGGALTDWKIISIPHQLSKPQVADVLDELGAVDNTKWRLITLKTNSSWSEYPVDFTTFVQGVGYFINVKTPVSLKVGEATTPSNNKSNLFKMTLKSGWNQIGNPYTFPMKWADVLAANSGTSAITTLKSFNNGAYTNATELAVFQGGFVLNTGTSPVTIDIPVVTSVSGRLDGSIVNGKTDEHYNLAEENWVLPITIKAGQIENLLGGIGMHPQALKGVDRFDDFNPPPITNYIQMDFAHPEHFLKMSTREVVPSQVEYKWEFTVESNMEGTSVLQWDNTRMGNNTKELILHDVDKGILINMRSQNSYEVNPKNAGVMEIYFGEDLKSKIKPQKAILGKAYPNPGAGDITIPFTLPDGQDNYHVSLEVYDLMGRKVASLVESQLPPGFYTSHWETTLSNLMNGLYTYRMKVAGKDKSEVLSGKVILNQ